MAANQHDPLLKWMALIAALFVISAILLSMKG